jgi:hypothetical protein
MDGLLHTIQINHNSQGCLAGLGGSVLNLWTTYIMSHIGVLKEKQIQFEGSILKQFNGVNFCSHPPHNDYGLILVTFNSEP